jgi:hypothetical protein
MPLLPAKVNRFKIELGLCVSISNDFLKGNFRKVDNCQKNTSKLEWLKGKLDRC